MKPKNLIQHPEGGRFCEVFRSKSVVSNNSNQNRSSLTHIYFSLNKGEVSKFHKVMSDEVWNLYEGDGLRLFIWDENLENAKIVELSAKNREYCHIIPAGMWQAAEPINDTILVGCSVAPGFDFEDFELINPNSLTAKKIIKSFPNLKRFVES